MEKNWTKITKFSKTKNHSVNSWCLEKYLVQTKFFNKMIRKQDSKRFQNHSEWGWAGQSLILLHKILNLFKRGCNPVKLLHHFFENKFKARCNKTNSFHHHYLQTSSNLFKAWCNITIFKQVWTCSKNDAIIQIEVITIAWAGLARAGLGWPGLPV